MKTYLITIVSAAAKRTMFSRTRHTMPAAVSAAEDAVRELHDMNSTRDSKGAWIDLDCATGWNPRTAPLVIVRGDYTLKAERL